MPKSPLHSSIVELIREHLALSLPGNYFIRQEQPITLWDSEPEPDVAIIRGARRDFLASHPTTAEVVVEITISTERLDRAKLEIYAEAGVRECWLLLAEERILERHSDPQAGLYRQVERATFPATLESTVIDGLTFLPEGLFPA